MKSSNRVDIRELQLNLFLLLAFAILIILIRLSSESLAITGDIVINYSETIPKSDELNIESIEFGTDASFFSKTNII